MAFSRGCMVLLLATIFVPSMDLAKEFIVGDERGWTPGFDYQAWAADKTFWVGDTLIFNYPVGEHNVFKVNGTAFQNCMVPAESEALANGSDHIVLASPGRKWYICGVGKHCNERQKLVINVEPLSPAPAPSPTPHGPQFGRWLPKKNLGIYPYFVAKWSIPHSSRGSICTYNKYTQKSPHPTKVSEAGA